MTSSATTTCGHCGMAHGPMCPFVKAVEYYPDGITVKRVEFRDAQPRSAHMPFAAESRESIGDLISQTGSGV